MKCSVDNLVLFQITVIMNMSGMEECEGECWAGWDTWDYWSSVWIEGVILPAIAALGIAGRRRKKLHCNLFVVREDHSALMFIHCLVLSASSSLKRRIEQIKFRRIYWIKSRKINNWWWLSSSINLSLTVWWFLLLSCWQWKGGFLVLAVWKSLFLVWYCELKDKIVICYCRKHSLCIRLLHPQPRPQTSILKSSQVSFCVRHIIFGEWNYFLSPHIEKIQIMLYNFQMCRSFKAWQHYYNKCGCKGI